MILDTIHATRGTMNCVNSRIKLFLQKTENNRLSTSKQPNSNPSTDVTFDNDLEHLTTLETAKRGKRERKIKKNRRARNPTVKTKQKLQRHSKIHKLIPRRRRFPTGRRRHVRIQPMLLIIKVKPCPILQRWIKHLIKSLRANMTVRK